MSVAPVPISLAAPSGLVTFDTCYVQGPVESDRIQAIYTCIVAASYKNTGGLLHEISLMGNVEDVALWICVEARTGRLDQKIVLFHSLDVRP